MDPMNDMLCARSFEKIRTRLRTSWQRFADNLRSACRRRSIDKRVNITLGRNIPHHSFTTAGFTLVEVLVVLAIISLLMGLVGPRVLAYLSESKVKAASLQIKGLSGALDLYYLD